MTLCLIQVLPHLLLNRKWLNAVMGWDVRVFPLKFVAAEHDAWNWMNAQEWYGNIIYDMEHGFNLNSVAFNRHLQTFAHSIDSIFRHAPKDKNQLKHVANTKHRVIKVLREAHWGAVQAWYAYTLSLKGETPIVINKL